MKRSMFGFFNAAVLAGAFAAAPGDVRAADVLGYSVQKGSFYVQTSAAAPVPVAGTPYAFQAEVEGDVFLITDATVRNPLGATLTLDFNADFSGLEFVFPAASASALNAAAPNGQYTFSIDSENDGFSLAMLEFSSSTFPASVPQVSNFSAAQTVDADADFTLTFNAHGGPGANDRFEFEILEQGFQIFSESGTGNSVLIPAGTLTTGSTNQARLRFVREQSRDTTSYPGAVGTVSLYNETQFNLIAANGGGGGGDDTDPPSMLFATPQNGATNVMASQPVTFIFSEEMVETQSIEWSSNVNPANFNYTWLNGGQALVATYLPGFPANATVTWKLNPSAGTPTNFRDLAGNVLPVNQLQGSFTVGSAANPNDPCLGEQNPGVSYGSISKQVNYVQTGNAAPVLDAESDLFFGASFQPGTNHTAITAVSLSGPNGTVALTNLFGRWNAFEMFETLAALEADHPAGNYTLNAVGAGSATLAVGSPTQIPVPQINNFNALASMNVAQDFTLNFSAFTAPNDATDGIFISISGDTGMGEFHAPDPCVPRLLPVTATSVVIPANTFKSGQKYNGFISFSRGSFNSNSVANAFFSSSAMNSTQFEFTIGGGPVPTKPMWTSIVRNVDGTLTYTVAGDTGVTIAIEGSDRAEGGFVQLSSVVLATGSTQYTVDPKLAAKRFLRARVL